MSSAVPLPMLSDRRSFVIIIGVDPHKRTHTASALEPGTHRVLATLQIDATLAGYRQLARWAAQFEVRRWAVENTRISRATSAIGRDVSITNFTASSLNSGVNFRRLSGTDDHLHSGADPIGCGVRTVVGAPG